MGTAGKRPAQAFEAGWHHLGSPFPTPEPQMCPSLYLIGVKMVEMGSRALELVISKLPSKADAHVGHTCVASVRGLRLRWVCSSHQDKQQGPRTAGWVH